MSTPPAGHPAFPTPLSPLIGREQEIVAVSALLMKPDVRLLTLTGPGGIGKTRLALAVATTLHDRFADGVWFVRLASIADPRLVVPSIAQALDVAERPDLSLLDGLKARLLERQTLLVLDNVEHVLDAAPAIAELIAACPRLTILVTSRVPLHLTGEREYPAQPLGLPDPSRALSVETVAESEAVALFVQRAQAVRPDFALTDANAQTVAAICRRLDGLPLAIELAAARIKAFPPEALLARLDHPLTLLTGGPRDAPERQQTLRNAIAWSYDLLAPAEQALFRRLALFPSGFTLAAAQAVCTGWGDHDIDIIDGLTSLADKSLIVPREPATNEAEDMPRFGMLETIRQYGLEELTYHEEVDATHRRHADYFFAWLERVTTQGWAGPVEATWLRRGDAELDNLRVALGWTVDHDPELALRLSRVMSYYWLIRGHFSEGRHWFDRSLRAGAGASEKTRADALNFAGFLATTQGDYAVARVCIEESLALYQRLNDRQGIGETLHGLARIAMFEGDLSLADRLYQQSNQIAYDLGNLGQLATGLGNRGYVARAVGDLDRAVLYVDEALGLARAGTSQGEVAELAADRARLAVYHENRDLAQNLLSESLTIHRVLNDSRMLAQALEICAWLAAMTNRPSDVPRLLGIADRLRGSVGVPIPPATQSDYDRYTPAIQKQLGADVWNAAWSEGCAMSPDQAITYALDVVENTSSEPSSVTATVSLSIALSNRELDVIRLLADGRSNQEIAATLFISPHTAAKHVANIMNKLGLESRTAIATYAVRHGLV